MATKKYQAIEQYWHRSGSFGVITRATLRSLQFIFAIIIAAIYGGDLAHASNIYSRAQTEWIYAEVVVVLSTITCIIHCFVRVVRVPWATWDATLFVLWLAQVGTFGNIYIRHGIQDQYVEATRSIQSMRVAVWIGLINMLLWLLTTVLGVAWCVRTRKVMRRMDKDEVEAGRALQRLREMNVEMGVVSREGDVKGQSVEESEQNEKCMEGDWDSPAKDDRKDRDSVVFFEKKGMMDAMAHEDRKDQLNDSDESRKI